ncbi:50S ribosomal protein L24e [Methanosarcinales archaeon]|uniref:Large ribosomal subunit protein eL24 n=1 Tax=Candidatus Syntropharchaeum caldarium TaxID=1838285 RepID=A0A1F2P754_9EURY|nr:MAG: Ribosomal protein L24e [Candidatus Syntrophoarchaeum caldarius]RLG34121.1 MAG: 50S ribosomal protein L24e [Methanosarcinales archaeon]
METKRCSFCGSEIGYGKGSIFVKVDGTILNFCSSKCRNNHNLGRIPRRVRWTETWIEKNR